MIAQQELQRLLNLSDQEKLALAHRLLESLMVKTDLPPVDPASPSGKIGAPVELSTEATQLIDLFGKNRSGDEEKIPFLSLAGIFSGGPGDTGERADEICREEIKKRSGFSLKVELSE